MKDETMKDALKTVFTQKDEAAINRLMEKMTGNTTTTERVSRLYAVLEQCREEAKDLSRKMASEGNQTGLHLLDVVDSLSEAMETFSKVATKR